jgi:hypothetical protein
MSASIDDYLSSKINVNEGFIAEGFKNLRDLSSDRNWLQLYNVAHSLLHNADFIKNINAEELCDKLFKQIRSEISEMQFINLVLPIAGQLYEKDKQHALEFLQQFEKHVAKPVVNWQSQMPAVRLNIAIAEIHLNMGAIDSAKEVIEDIKGFGEIAATEVHAPFYKLRSRYFEAVHNAASYYVETMKYLGYESQSALSVQQKSDYALKLATAALDAEDIFDVGDLLDHWVTKALPENFKWLITLLEAFNNGKLDLYRQFKSKLGAPELHNMVEEKIRMIAFAILAMTKQAEVGKRVLQFDDVAKVTGFSDHHDVQMIVLKAFAKGLASGGIDDTQKQIRIKNVKPRHLSLEQIPALIESLELYRNKVSAMVKVVEKQAEEILKNSGQA